MDGFLNYSGERFQYHAISRTRFTSFVWTQGRFVKKTLRFHKYQASRGLNLKKKSFIMQINKKKSLVKG